MKLMGNMKIREDQVYIGKYNMGELKEKYGTPLYIIDEEDFIARARLYRESFSSGLFETEVIYASKALLNVYMADLVSRQDLSIDVVSGGELYTVLKAGFPRERIYFHGNNKLISELEFALDEKIGGIIIDNRQEFLNLRELLRGTSQVQKVFLRVNPGIEAHTHKYIQTSKDDSKFGESIYDPRTYELIREIYNCPNLDFRGLHCHIGSQVFQGDSFFKSARVMLDFYGDLKAREKIEFKELNLGGGFGSYYTEEDKPMDMEKFLSDYIGVVEAYTRELGLDLEKLYIEPGRSLISNSGSTLYTVGGLKETYGGKEYIFVDGGMTDNPRPALYQAKYEAIVANKPGELPTNQYTIAGKCCESGDILIEDISLPRVEVGDLILVASTGAYNYSMSSNYNRIERPAMVFIGEEGLKLGVRRQGYEDLIREDIY